MKKPIRKTSAPGQKGFSLLEVLVAFSILALSLGVLLRIFGGDGRVAALGDEHSRAVILAESLLANAGVETPLEPGEFSGSIDGKYAWIMRVVPFPLSGDLLPDQLPFKPYWVELTLEWGEQNDLRSFSLETLRLVAAVRRRGGVR